jgi:hypothetical protein
MAVVGLKQFGPSAIKKIERAGETPFGSAQDKPALRKASRRRMEKVGGDQKSSGKTPA